MITLTTPSEINSVLGGNVPVAYNKMVVAPFTMDGIKQIATAQLQLTATGAPTMQPITGTLRISAPTSELIIEVPQLDFYRRVVMSSGQTTGFLSTIETAQQALENALITLGVVAGVRTAGV